VLSHSRDRAFVTDHPILILSNPEFNVTRPAAALRLDSEPSPLPEKPSPENTQPTKTMPARPDRPLRGIGLLLLSGIFLGTSDATSKYLSKTLPSIEITWIRFLVFALIMIPAMVPGSPLFALRTQRPVLQVTRGMALFGSSLLFISGLGFLPIAEASATSFVAPLFVTALSIVFLGEKVGMRRWMATAVGLVGVLIVLRPGTSAFHPAAVFPVASALAWASCLIMTRRMSGLERAMVTMTYSAIVGLVVVSALVPVVWITPTWYDILFGTIVGVASTAGQWIVVLAFRYAGASVLAPFSYVQLLWVTFLGFVIFGEVPDIWTIAGAAVIVASGLYTAHRERVRHSQLAALAVELSPNA
jgi:drug/metabolite transporter (DMT)-like permease